MFKRKSKDTNTQLGMNTSELLLLFETRSFLQEILAAHIRLSKWQKTLEEGKVYYTFTAHSISIEMSTLHKKWIFTLSLQTMQFSAQFSNFGTSSTKYIPLLEDDALISEIHDILVLIYYIDFLNTKNINGFRKNKENLDQHLQSMDFKYSFGYMTLNQSIEHRSMKMDLSNF